MLQDLGVRMIACDTSMTVMGVKREELIEGVEFGWVATYLEDAAKSKIALFIEAEQMKIIYTWCDCG